MDEGKEARDTLAAAGGDLNLLDAGRKRDQLAAVFESVFGETAAQPASHALVTLLPPF